MKARHSKFAKLLDRLAAHPVALAFTGFAVTVTIIMPDHLPGA